MASFLLLNFGCRASQADGAALKRQLLDAGLQEAARVEQSHFAVLNTCTVTATADAEVRQIIRRIHRSNPRCRILVTGCYAQRAPEEIAALSGVAWVLGNSHKHRVADFLSADFACQATAPSSQPTTAREAPAGPAPTSLVQILNPGADRLPKENHSILPQVWVGRMSREFHFAPVFPDDRTRPTLKVQDGCNARCSFCVIPSVRGPSRSLAPGQAVEQVRRLEHAGYKEIVLSGINLGSYGRDLDPRTSFLGLLEQLLAQTAIPRIRISSIEPMDVSSELIRLVAREPRLADHFHVPLQSGSDRTLRQMNRRYWARQYAERLLAIRESLPNAAIGADVMVGFPGETAQDHAISASYIESLPFTYLHIFPFSARPGTPAAARTDQVNGRIAHERGHELRVLMARKRRAFLNAQVGRTLSGLTLREAGGEARSALTSNYLKVLLATSDVAPNTLIPVIINGTQEDDLSGCPAATECSSIQPNAFPRVS